MKHLLTLIALLSLSVSAETGRPYTLVLITQGRHFEWQLGTFDDLRECKREGIEKVSDHDVYIGFGCIQKGNHPG